MATWGVKPPAVRKTTQLKQLITTPGQMGFLMEAHNGLSAKIVEEAGFKAIWGSGLSISAAMGVRDSNEASYTQVRTSENDRTRTTREPRQHHSCTTPTLTIFLSDNRSSRCASS